MMNFFETVEKRRSIRKFSDVIVPPEIIEKALDAALLAPNSSNLQTWQFFWINSEDNKKNMIPICLGQNGAKTAKEFVVAVASPSLWKKTTQDILKQPVSPNAEKLFKQYYQKLIPFNFGYQFLAPIKWLLYNVIGIFRPMMRHPWSWNDREIVCVKSTALACENFMLAITAQGYDTLPMEGFDEYRLKNFLHLKFSDRVVMVIAIGKKIPGSEWGERFRSDRSWFVHKI